MKQLDLEKDIINVVGCVNNISSRVVSNRGDVTLRDLENLSCVFGEYANLFETMFKEEKIKRDRELLINLGKEIDLGIYEITRCSMLQSNSSDVEDLLSVRDRCSLLVEKIDSYAEICNCRGIVCKYDSVKAFLLKYRKSLDTMINLKNGTDTDENDMLDMLSFILNRLNY